MKYCITFFIPVFFVANGLMANNDSIRKELASTQEEDLFIVSQDIIENSFYVQVETDSVTIGAEGRQVKFKRGKAILFTLFTGLFGGHRVYFGTHQRTPIIYSLTFGGLGILPLIDLANIIFTKDLSKFEHKTQIIMWGK